MHKCLTIVFVSVASYFADDRITQLIESKGILTCALLNADKIMNQLGTTILLHYYRYIDLGQTLIVPQNFGLKCGHVGI